MISLILAEKIASLFLIMIIGIVIVKAKVLKPSDSKVLSQLALYVVSPCMIVQSFQIDYSDALRDGLLLSLVAAVVFNLVLLGSGIVFKKIFRLSAIEQTSITYTNAGNLIVAIVSSVYGSEWLIFTNPFITVWYVFIWSHCSSTIAGEPKIDIKKVIFNINIIATAFGCILFFTGIRFPALVTDGLKTVSGMIAPLCMFTSGMMIGNMKVKKMFAFKRVWLVAALRLIVMPLITIAMVKLSGAGNLVENGTTILTISLLATMTPTATTVAQMAILYDNEAEYASIINAVTTVLCILTMPLMMGLFGL